MVYLYKKIVGGKPYYYLRASERKGKKVLSKDIAYLGSTIEEVRKSLDKKEFKDKIRKAYKTIKGFLESNHWLEKAKELRLKKDDFLGEKLTEIEACKLHYNNHFKKLDNITKKEILKNFVIEFAFNTASIEGNTINLEQARNLLADGLTPENKTLREIYDLQNSEKVFFELIDLKEEITHEFIIGVHDSLLENIDPRKGYRTVDIRVIKSNFDATPAPYVKTDMDLLIKWYEEHKTKLHPLTLATIFHHKFEKIHPFMDGNGRTGRMILSYILLKNDYPALIIRKKTKSLYLNALRKADKSNLTKSSIGDYSEIVQFNAEEMIDTYWNIFL
ncbi:Fic family protein [Candidatus Pacearchaeota archaeon]|nr:Fic family protein [Candidatus Pacearchaeota archaeon]